VERIITSGILIGLLLGIIAGVELVRYADARVCPQDIYLDKTKVIPLPKGAYFPEVHRILQNSQKSIHMSLFELKYYKSFSTSKSNIIVQDLIEAHKRGVDVQIIVDDFSTENNALQLLKDEGIAVKLDPANVTTHTKLIIVDGEIVVLGSTNLSFYGLEKNNEVDVILISPEAAESYERYFQQLWQLT